MPLMGYVFQIEQALEDVIDNNALIVESLYDEMAVSGHTSDKNFWLALGWTEEEFEDSSDWLGDLYWSVAKKERTLLDIVEEHNTSILKEQHKIKNEGE